MEARIESASHPLIKYLIRLRCDRAFRREKQEIIITGYRVIQELQHYPITMLFCAKKEPCFATLPTTLLSQKLFLKITGIQDPYIALLPMPSLHFTTVPQRVLLLDGIQDPGNLGTLLRTSCAFHHDYVYLTETSCDPFNDKALRAAKGATLRLKIAEGSLEHFSTTYPHHTFYIADLQGAPFSLITPKLPYALILSREGQGVRSHLPGMRVHIPMQGPMESLNVAAAGAILLQHFQSTHV